jgi:hypothetical protein
MVFSHRKDFDCAIETIRIVPDRLDQRTGYLGAVPYRLCMDCHLHARSGKIPYLRGAVAFS